VGDRGGRRPILIGGWLEVRSTKHVRIHDTHLVVGRSLDCNINFDTFGNLLVPHKLLASIVVCSCSCSFCRVVCSCRRLPPLQPNRSFLGRRAWFGNASIRSTTFHVTNRAVARHQAPGEGNHCCPVKVCVCVCVYPSIYQVHLKMYTHTQ
jgi:hypothetical protein